MTKVTTTIEDCDVKVHIKTNEELVLIARTANDAIWELVFSFSSVLKRYIEYASIRIKPTGTSLETSGVHIKIKIKRDNKYCPFDEEVSVSFPLHSGNINYKVLRKEITTKTNEKIREKLHRMIQVQEEVTDLIKKMLT